jgi:tetratricopeptide (TPR) repeat protein
MIPFLPLIALSVPENAAATEGSITTLDPVFVEASAGNPWQYISLPGFEIISHCPDSFNETYVRALRTATAARLALLPEAFWGQLATPIKIVLYNRPPERREGIYRTNPIDLSWSSEDGAILGSDTILLSHPVTMGDGDTFINCGNYWDIQSESSNLSIDLDSAIRIGVRVPRFPAWFIAGLEGPCGLFRNRLIDSTLLGDVVILSNARWISSAETIAIQNEGSKGPKGRGSSRRTLLPLAKVFNGSVPLDQREVWGAEAALFVRWGLYKSGARQPFLDFVDQATREPITEPLFKRYLGIGYAEAQKRLSDFLPAAVSESIRVPLATPPDVELRTREATSDEVARIIGDWGRLEGRSGGLQYSEYRRECMEQADRLFERISSRRNGDPLFLAAFGLYELQVGDSLRARQALEAATAAGVVRPRAYVELASLRLDASLPSAQEGIGDLSDAEFAEIVGLLTAARVQMPALPSCYRLLARVLEHAPTKPSREDLRALDEAVRLFPQDAALAYQVANLYKKLGNSAKATAIIDRAMGFAESDGERELLSDFRAKKAR